MRNPDLDKTLPEDKFIGKMEVDADLTHFRMVNDIKIIQIEEWTQKDIDFNLVCNRSRVELHFKGKL